MKLIKKLIWKIQTVKFFTEQYSIEKKLKNFNSQLTNEHNSNNGSTVLSKKLQRKFERIFSSFINFKSTYDKYLSTSARLVVDADEETKASIKNEIKFIEGDYKQTYTLFDNTVMFLDNNFETLLASNRFRRLTNKAEKKLKLDDAGSDIDDFPKNVEN